MKRRSRAHTLNVAASRLESDGANPLLVKELRKMAADADKRWTEEDEKRTERQRTLFNMLPSSNATDRLKAAMLQRAYDLLWDGDAEACDAILEWLPSNDVEAMLNCWQDDQASKKPTSRFYEARDAA